MLWARDFAVGNHVHGFGAVSHETCPAWFPRVPYGVRMEQGSCQKIKGWSMEKSSTID